MDMRTRYNNSSQTQRHYYSNGGAYDNRSNDNGQQRRNQRQPRADENTERNNYNNDYRPRSGNTSARGLTHTHYSHNNNHSNNHYDTRNNTNRNNNYSNNHSNNHHNTRNNNNRNNYNHHDTRNNNIRNNDNNNHGNDNYNSTRNNDNNYNMSAIVEAVVQQLGGHNPTLRPHHTQQPQQQRQQPQQPQNHTTYHSTDDPQTTETPYIRSDNPEFHDMWKALFKVVQIDHHLDNWNTLPPSLKRSLNSITENITPPDPTADLRNNISSILSGAGNEIRRKVQAHLSERLTARRAELAKFTTLDRERAVDVAYKHLHKRLGPRIDGLRHRLEVEALRIGTDPSANQSHAGPTEAATTTETWTIPKPNTLAKRPRTTDTPPGLDIRNQYAILLNLDENELTIMDSPPPSPRSQRPPLEPKRPQKTFHSKYTPNIELRPETKTLVIGDSNLRRTKEEAIPDDCQVAVLPGANVSHILDAANQIPTNNNLTDIVLSVGINHRCHSFSDHTEKELNKLIPMLQLPNTTVHVLGVAINPGLEKYEKTNLQRINTHLHGIFLDRYIEPIDEAEVQATDDGIHYTDETVEKIWGSIVNHLTKMHAIYTTKN